MSGYVENGITPLWLTQTPEGFQYVHMSDHECWDKVYDYDQWGEDFREPLPLADKRTRTNHVIFGENLHKGRVNRPILHLTHLANIFSDNLGNPDVQTLYTANFVIGTRQSLKEAVVYVGKGAAVLAPERGARILKIMLETMGVNPKQMPFYRASRKPVNGHYTVAVKMTDEFIEGNGNVLFVDDCKARYGSEDYSLRLWMEAMRHRPNRYASVVGVGVRRSVEYQHQELTQSGIDHRIWVAGESNGMNDHDYLQLTKEEKDVLQLPSWYDKRVGDMGTAMSFTNRQREWERPLYEALTMCSGVDERVLDMTELVIRYPEKLHQTAEVFRKVDI